MFACARLTSCLELVAGRSHGNACGAPFVGSNTAPVREVIQDDRTGWLVDFFNATEIAKVATAAMSRQNTIHAVKMNAEKTVRAFNLESALWGIKELSKAVNKIQRVLAMYSWRVQRREFTANV